MLFKSLQTYFNCVQFCIFPFHAPAALIGPMMTESEHRDLIASSEHTWLNKWVRSLADDSNVAEHETVHRFLVDETRQLALHRFEKIRAFAGNVYREVTALGMRFYCMRPECYFVTNVCERMAEHRLSCWSGRRWELVEQVS